jgi:chromosome segregation ATPase
MDQDGDRIEGLEALTAAEARVEAALERLASAMDRLAMSPPDPQAGEVAGLTEALEAERAANEQLEERVRAIKERQEKVVGRLEAEVAGLKAAVGERDAAFEGLRAANDRLRENNMALREAILSGAPDADLVNRAMAHELDGLRAARAADRAEMDLIIAELRPHFEETAHA